MATRTFVGDFETTVYDGQTDTEVWASASVELGTEEVRIFHSIDEQWEWFKSCKGNLVVYYHNLKFDGNFWMSFLLSKTDLTQAYEVKPDGSIKFFEKKYMPNNSFQYSISDKGQWYKFIIKVNNRFIEFRDSYKLLPFKVRDIGRAFNTKHQKLDMEYTGYRFAGCRITDEEKHYIANDVLVVKEALEIMFAQGHKKLTIGSCCLAEFKNRFKTSLKVMYDYDEAFPLLSEFKLDDKLYTYNNADAYIRKSYRGGWCYVVEGKKNKLFGKGITADVNSLYPSMMSSESGNYYPIGVPHFWKGNHIPQEAITPTQDGKPKYYFIRVKTRFKLKEGYLPFIQIKDSYLYRGNEMLKTSDVYDRKTKKYYSKWIDDFGEEHEAIPTLTMTCTDWILMNEHYELSDTEILDGCWFYTDIGLFDDYIDHWAEVKKNSKGAMRTLAKLFLNNLYGKFASSTESNFKIAFLNEDGVVKFNNCKANDKREGYIAIGSAITSYARNFTIRCAQQNYYGEDKRGFIYADTDSIHCDLNADELKGLKVHDKNFCCWKLESTWDKAIFVRQKTYIEHVIEEDLEPIDKPYYNVKCAGMPDRCKDLFVMSLKDYKKTGKEKLNEEETEFVKHTRTLKDFKVGLVVPSSLKPKTIKGGVLLVSQPYKMRENLMVL